jgi:hypothetical protein
MVHYAAKVAEIYPRMWGSAYWDKSLRIEAG